MVLEDCLGCAYLRMCCNFLGEPCIHPPPAQKKINIQVKSRNWPCMLKQLAQGVVKPMLKRRQVESCPALKPAQGPRRTSKTRKSVPHVFFWFGRNGRGAQKKRFTSPKNYTKSHPPWKIVVLRRSFPFEIALFSGDLWVFEGVMVFAGRKNERSTRGFSKLSQFCKNQILLATNKNLICPTLKTKTQHQKLRVQMTTFL